MGREGRGEGGEKREEGARGLAVRPRRSAFRGAAEREEGVGGGRLVRSGGKALPMAAWLKLRIKGLSSVLYELLLIIT